MPTGKGLVRGGGGGGGGGRCVHIRQGEEGKWPHIKKHPCQGKHREFGNIAKTQGIWFCSSCKFPDFKGKRCFDILPDGDPGWGLLMEPSGDEYVLSSPC